MQTHEGGGGAVLGNGLAGGTLSLFSRQRQAQDVPNSPSSPLECKWIDPVEPETSMTDGKAGRCT